LHEEKEMKKTLFFIFAALCCDGLASPPGKLHAELLAGADVILKVQPNKLEFFDFGFGRTTPEGFFRPFLIPREDVSGFLKSQKNKEMILIEYLVLSLDGALLAAEVDRTCSFFKNLNYKRVVLVAPTNQGLSVLRDTSGMYEEYYFDWYDGRSSVRPSGSEPPEPTKAR
jgi:hypothetical protein